MLKYNRACIHRILYTHFLLNGFFPYFDECLLLLPNNCLNWLQFENHNHRQIILHLVKPHYQIIQYFNNYS